MCSQGKIFPPIIQAMQYDLLIPGNWEIIYGKKIMLDVMKKHQTNVIVANMFDEKDKEPLFPPY